MFHQGGSSVDGNCDVVRESFFFATVFLFNSALTHHLKEKFSGQVKYLCEVSKLYDTFVKLVLYHHG
jgi:hypothetical protein